MEMEESPVRFLKRKLETYLGYNPAIDELFDDALFMESEMVEMAYNQGRDDADEDGANDAGAMYYLTKYGHR